MSQTQYGLQEVFLFLKQRLENYAGKGLLAVQTEGEKYELYSYKEYNVVSLKTGRHLRRKKTYFAGLAVRKYHVSFYFMPLLEERKYFESRYPEFMRLLKGKTCFHISNIDSRLAKDMEAMVDDGFRFFQERGYVA